jgi:hypothetical protein
MEKKLRAKKTMLPISAFALLAIVVGAAVVEMSDSMAASDTGKTYNVIYVLTDDQRYDELGFMNSEIDTPNMDRLAREGVHFRHLPAI